MKTIFIVEDEADIAGLIKFNLESAGYDTVRFDRAEPALARAIASPPSLILLDIMLPGIDGLELCRRIRAVNELSQVPVIFVTARISEDDRLQGFDAGADDYLTNLSVLANWLRGLTPFCGGQASGNRTIRSASGRWSSIHRR